jgi:hypothetical protein
MLFITHKEIYEVSQNHLSRTAGSASEPFVSDHPQRLKAARRELIANRPTLAALQNALGSKLNQGIERAIAL